MTAPNCRSAFQPALIHQWQHWPLVGSSSSKARRDLPGAPAHDRPGWPAPCRKRSRSRQERWHGVIQWEYSAWTTRPCVPAHLPPFPIRQAAGASPSPSALQQRPATTAGVRPGMPHLICKPRIIAPSRTTHQHACLSLGCVASCLGRALPPCCQCTVQPHSLKFSCASCSTTTTVPLFREEEDES